MTNKELVSKLQNVVDDYKTVYMWGVVGSPVTESIIAQKVKQYPFWYTSDRVTFFKSFVNKGYFAFDCVCLIKAILWGWNGDTNKTYGGAVYTSNGVPDIDANTMIYRSLNVSTDFSKIEIGEALWCEGHIGVYIGNGKAIECTSSWSNNVQVTAVKNIGTISGLNLRQWTKHGKLPYITYEAATSTPPDKSSVWATESWQWAFENGLFDGTNPTLLLSREQTAEAFFRLYKKGALKL